MFGAAAQRFRRDRAAMLGLALVLGLALFAALGPIVLGQDPNASDLSLSRGPLGAPPGPSASHWLGTDPLMRDLLARLASGARISLSISLLATLVSTSLGAAVGVTAGWLAGTRLGFVDAILMRLVDVVLALPFLLFVMAVGVAVGRADVGTILLVLGLTGWTLAARLARGKTMEIARVEFVQAARALGATPGYLIRRHVLPNLAPTLLIVATTSVAQMILAEAALSYLTVGVPPPRATWGRMLHEAEPFLGTRMSLVAAPGFAILLAVVGWSRVGEGLRAAFDPQARRPARRRWPVDLALAGLGLALVAVAAPSQVKPPMVAASPAPEPVRGGVLHVATYANVRTLDPALGYDEAANALEGLLFDRLVNWDASGSIAPELAESFEVSATGRRTPSCSGAACGFMMAPSSPRPT